MSGCSDSNPCPRCGKTMDTYSDYKPFDMCSGECMYCGFYYFTDCRVMSKKALKTARKGREFKKKVTGLDKKEMARFDKSYNVRKDR